MYILNYYTYLKKLFIKIYHDLKVKKTSKLIYLKKIMNVVKQKKTIFNPFLKIYVCKTIKIINK